MVGESISNIADLKPDSKNARKHSRRNLQMIAEALHEVGPARSIVIDENGVVLAGNGVVDAAAEAGIERVRVVEADGKSLVAVKVSGLTDDQKRKLAYYDNRTSELAEWNAEQVAADLEGGLKLDGIFSELELDNLLGRREGEAGPEQDYEMGLQPYECYDYIMLIFRKEFDFASAIEAFGLEKKQSPGRTNKDVGLCRVVDGAKILKMVNARYESGDSEP